MKKILIILIFFNFISNSYANERFIPLELFTGGEIRDDKEIKYTNANLIFGKNKKKKITGPEEWVHPRTGEKLKVYKRTRKAEGGLKTQLFSITNNKQCIGRVWDGRRGGKLITNGCKFPLGFWKKGESRTFLGASGGKPRKIVLKILRLGDDQYSSLKFNWKLYNGSGKLMDNNDYTFEPGKALTILDDN